ncbi:MAG: hypothetical protein K0Q97_1489 [Bacillota bacterium]|jgi:uncharacterized membrane protein YkvA (DUF1232 family)|nr:hypothetical protein [Bacillota bacterium]
MNIISKLSLIFKFVFDKQIPLKHKWWILIPLIYILSPIDLIPAPIFGFSVVDDIVMIVYLLSVVNEKTTKYNYNQQDQSEKKEQTKQGFFNKNNNKNDYNNKNDNKETKEEIIEGVEYKVEKDDE